MTQHYGYERCYHWSKLGKGRMGSLCIIPYSYVWLYNDHKIKSLLKKIKEKLENTSSE